MAFCGTLGRLRRSYPIAPCSRFLTVNPEDRCVDPLPAVEPSIAELPLITLRHTNDGDLPLGEALLIRPERPLDPQLQVDLAPPPIPAPLPELYAPPRLVPRIRLLPPPLSLDIPERPRTPAEARNHQSNFEHHPAAATLFSNYVYHCCGDQPAPATVCFSTSVNVMKNPIT